MGEYLYRTFAQPRSFRASAGFFSQEQEAPLWLTFWQAEVLRWGFWQATVLFWKLFLQRAVVTEEEVVVSSWRTWRRQQAQAPAEVFAE
jgi:hypothetical protein